jgi:PAS domain-containing protein
MPNSETLRQRSHRDLNNRSIPGTIANGVLWPVIFIPFGFHFENPFTAWLCAAVLAIVSILRFSLYLNFSKLEQRQPGLWLKLFGACSLAQAAIWGFLFSSVNSSHVLEPISYALILVIAGVSSGAVPALSAVRNLALSNLTFILGPIIVYCLLIGQFPLASLIIVYLLTLSTICISTAKEYIASFNTELRLKESQQQMDLLVNSINGVVWEYDIGKERFNFVNRRAESIYGLHHRAVVISEFSFSGTRARP